MEAIFDTCYLLFDLVVGFIFLAKANGNMLFTLYGILTLTLCGGDAFHLVPRIISVFKGSNEKIKRQLGIGLQVSSITMTVFYIILLYIWKLTFPTLCGDEGNLKLSMIRNTVFAVTGMGIIILYAMSGNTGNLHMTRMVAAIIISFGCYLPVTLLSRKNLKLVY